MRISRSTVDKLGIKLYDKVSAVVAELVANAYDADAHKVTVTLPLDRWLATRHAGQVRDQGLIITVKDDGHGMTPKEASRDYLVVGRDRRAPGNQGGKSRSGKRRVMGHKGIGKLAPFGICKQIEVRSAGFVKRSTGCVVSHFTLDYDRINKETDEYYEPTPGRDDGGSQTESGTVVTLTNFLQRRTPDRETFHRQLAARFGLKKGDFEIEVIDSSSGDRFIVGDLKIDVMSDTRLDVKGGRVFAEDGSDLGTPLLSESGDLLKTNGWLALAKQPYKNPELAGVRIYARGKIVATTRDFEVQSGFTGEHTIRSYLVGELHAEWLDDEEDLIRTDRQDILWASGPGQSLQSWGVHVIKLLADRSSAPRREAARALFFSRSGIEAEAKRRFHEPEVQEAALKLARAIGSTLSLDELDDPVRVDGLKEIVLTVAPHRMLIEELGEISSNAENTLQMIAALLGSARVAEAASLGQVAQERLRAIDELDRKSKGGVPERELQSLLEEAPWLIEPRWTVLSANRPMSEFWDEFRKWWSKNHSGEPFPTPAKPSATKRPDFVLVGVGYALVVVEIKKPGHDFDEEDYERLHAYYEALEEFLDANKEYRKGMSGRPLIVLIADGVKLKGTSKTAFQGQIKDGVLTQQTWTDFLAATRDSHRDFLNARSKVGGSSALS